MLERRRIKVRGIVQGVGFRPFVYRLATELRMKGFVRNTTAGVDIDIEGTKQGVARFLERLKKDKPRAARIDAVAVKSAVPRGYRAFVITESKKSEGFTQISPDIATCEDCTRELNSRIDRRYRYPFINCTNCGPRYSIICETPYDRQRTSMRKFTMCADCAQEFQDVGNRRFHAQPDCCARCGPVFTLYDNGGKRIETRDAIVRAAALLKRGAIIAIKGIGGFHIACDATNAKAVIRLRKLKQRPTKPFAIMVRAQDLNKVVYMSREEKKIALSPVAPVLLMRKKGFLITDAVAPNNPYLGVMVPYAPVHHLLLREIPYLVMTSANIQDEPLVTDDENVMNKLGNLVTFNLTHNRSIENRCDDSVGFYLPAKGFSIIRRSRGYAPVPIDLPLTVQPTLAVGPYLKNTFTLAHKRDAYVSPHIGDLDNLETMEFFEEMVDCYTRWFRIHPELIVHDLHPDYLSTKLAQKMPGKKVGVQHHIAHFVSCLGENMVDDDAIGIAFDGTGFGTDGKIWGGEFLVGNQREQNRVGYLEYLPLPGGEASIRKPYRISIAYLFTLLGMKDLPRVHQKLGINSQEVDTIVTLVKQKQVIYTSSMGRLFDCVAGLLGLMKEITFEAEAAINLEYIAAQNITKHYPYVIKQADTFNVEVADTLAAVVRDIRKGVSPRIISAKFHNTVVDFSLDMATKLRKLYGMKNVCLSGGVFQNRYLLKLMIEKLERANFKVYVHHKLPTNDGCISYGQVICGNAERSAQ